MEINIHQIKQKTLRPIYRKSRGFENKERLQKEMIRRGLPIKLKGKLKGGVDSQIYAANLKGNNVVVKHTEDRGASVYNPPFTPIDFFVDRENHNLDTYILQKLKNTEIRVPNVIHHFPDITTTVMEDMRESGFRLMSDLILSGYLPDKSAKHIAEQLVALTSMSKSWKKFTCFKTPEAQIFERGLELRLSYPNTQMEYLDLQKEFVSRRENWMWPDGHPKNIFIDDDSNVAFIDFGGSYWGDQRFMLPNFLGQFIVLCNSGFYDKDKCLNYIELVVRTYKTLENIDESLACKYTGMEILHRSFGKWIDGVNTVSLKVKNIRIGLSIFDLKIVTIDNLLSLLNKML